MNRFGAPLLAAAMALPGCAVLTAKPPSVDVLAVHLQGVGLTEQVLGVTLCVTNPNTTELAFNRVNAVLDVAGSPLADGASVLAVRLPPQSSTAVPFTVVTTVRNLGPQLAGIFGSVQVDYRLHGSVSLTGYGGLTIPYSRGGRLDPLTGGLALAGTATDPTPSRCAIP